MYVHPKFLRGAKRFDMTQFRPVPVAPDARKRANYPNPCDFTIRPI